MTTMSKRSYTRRTEDERIAELEAQIMRVKERMEAKKQKDSPLLREWTKAQRALRNFIQAAAQSGRNDLSLSAEAFLAGLERSMQSAAPQIDAPRRRSRSAGADDDS
jgi:small-conductance mechanosensitive channel